MAKVALIAGTGFYDLPNLTERSEKIIETKYGAAKVLTGRLGEVELVFLTRHGSGHTIPPHMINYRANIKALQDLGVSSVIAVNVVGGVDPTLKPGDLTLIDDFIDYTSGRIGTFFDGGDEFGVKHIDMTNVYDKRIQSALWQAHNHLEFHFELVGSTPDLMDRDSRRPQRSGWLPKRVAQWSV